MTLPPQEERQGWPWLGAWERHPEPGAGRPVIGEHGMVSTPHHLASRIGLDTLRAGGNAVDAAVAASAALMVAVPMQCSPGGDAFWIIRDADGTVAALDASGPAPAAADAETLRRRGLAAIPPRSPEAVTVPGAVAGWAAALQRFGTRPLAELVEPAARLAEHGFFVSRHLQASFCAALPALEAWGSLALWSSDGKLPALYGRLRQPRLAAALRLIGESQGRALYEGALARAVAAAVRERGGWLAEADLAGYRCEWLAPITGRFRGLTLHTTPPATQGVALLEAASILERLAPEPLATARAEAAHLMIEAVAKALEDRDRFIADRSRLVIDPRTLLAADRIGAIAAAIDRDRAGARRVEPGRLIGRSDTAHLAVVDAERRAVSLIQSLFFDFGTGIPVADGGFTLQSRGAAFCLVPGALNELAPGRRPPHTLAPTIATRDGALALALGCMGGDGQIQTQLQLLVAMLDGELHPQQAASCPRWYLDRTAHPVSRVLVERDLAPAVVDGLRARGHEVAVLSASEEIMGHCQLVAAAPGGALVGAADPRSDGQAAGW